MKTLSTTPNPFSLKGLRAGETLSDQFDDARTNARQFIRIGDAVVAFVDGFCTAEEYGDPDHMTVQDHLEIAAQSGKFGRFLAGKNTEELLEQDMYIGPCVVGIPGLPTQEVVEAIRLAIYKPNDCRY